jgi:hypothetical protein
MRANVQNRNTREPGLIPRHYLRRHAAFAACASGVNLVLLILRNHMHCDQFREKDSPNPNR